MKRLAIFLLLCLPLMGQGIISVSGRREPAAGGCNAFEETDWDNLTGWTQDSTGNFAADSTNDRLNALMRVEFDWIQNDTTTTDEDQCVLAQWVTLTQPSVTVKMLLFRANGSGNNAYALAWFLGPEDVWWYTLSLTSSGYTTSWESGYGSGLSIPDDGDYISACVQGTGNDTVFTYWDHGASDPGDCRTDWGTADETWTDNPTTAVNSGSKVGFATMHWGIDTTDVYDEFVGSDY